MNRSAATRAILAQVPDDLEAIHRRMGIAAPDGEAPTVQEALQEHSRHERRLGGQ
jgi:hypothetical protein